MTPALLAWLAALRVNAGEGEGFAVVHSRHRGTVPISFDDVRACADDDALWSLVNERCKKD